MAERIVIPGDAGGLFTLASQMQGAGEDVQSVRDRVATNGLEGAWSGAASDAFRSTLHSLPGELDSIAGAFMDASGAVGGFAGRLEELQSTAAWLNSEMARREEEMNAAAERAAVESRNVDAAARSHAAATDPASKSAAASALSYSEGLLRSAKSDLEEAGSALGGLGSTGAELMSEYRDAVNSTVSTLDTVRHSVHRGLLGSIAHAAAGVFKGAEHLIGSAWHDAKAVAEEGLKEFDKHWKTIRRFLEDAAEVVAVAALVALAVGTGGATLMVLGLVLSGAVMGGDGIEAVRGNKDALHDLGGDAVDLVLSFGAWKGAKVLGEGAKTADAAEKEVDDGVEDSRGYFETKSTDAIYERLPSKAQQMFANLSDTAKQRLSLANAWVNSQVHGVVHDKVDSLDGVEPEPRNPLERMLDAETKGPTSLSVPLGLALVL